MPKRISSATSLALRVCGHRLADADRTVGEDRVGKTEPYAHGGNRVVGDGFGFAVSGREDETDELRFGCRPHPAVGIFSRLAHAEVVVRGRTVEIGPQGPCQQLDAAQAVGADETAFRIESDRESLARDAFALHAERSGRSLGREAGRRVVAAQYELVGGDLVERVEQSPAARATGNAP